MPTATTATYRARWVLPVESPPIRDGVVRVANGCIRSVGTYAPGEAITDLGDVALLPGFVNAHTHLEFSPLTKPLGAPGTPFPNWIAEVVAFRRRLSQNLSNESIADDVYQMVCSAVTLGLKESWKAGVVALGEICTNPWFNECFGEQFSPDTLNCTFFLEYLGLDPEKRDFSLQVVHDHLAGTFVSGDFRRGLSPHAPYTVSPEMLQILCERSWQARVPVAMHVAESLDELELLRSHSGALVQTLESLGAWLPSELPRGLRPLDYLEILAAAHQTLVIHGNFLVREEMEFVADRRDKMTVVYCPRTQAYFPHGAYPLAEMLVCGVRVAVGTDSRASNPDLSVLSELRHIARHHPGIAPEEILKMGTLYGAEALGLADELGSLAPGKKAAFAIVPLPEAKAEPYELLFHGDASAARLPQRDI